MLHPFHLILSQAFPQTYRGLLPTRSQRSDHAREPHSLLSFVPLSSLMGFISLPLPACLMQTLTPSRTYTLRPALCAARLAGARDTALFD